MAAHGGGQACSSRQDRLHASRRGGRRQTRAAAGGAVRVRDVSSATVSLVGSKNRKLLEMKFFFFSISI